MKRYAYIVLLLLAIAPPHGAYATLPEIVNLGKSASRQHKVKHESVGSFMLGMASTFADKEQRATFKMLDNIEIIECKNRDYAPTLLAKALSIVDSVGARFIGSDDDGTALNELYGTYKDDTITELIIITKSHSGDVSIVAMSGTIPHSRLDEIGKIKR